jgi:hypothetical protein
MPGNTPREGLLRVTRTVCLSIGFADTSTCSEGGESSLSSEAHRSPEISGTDARTGATIAIRTAEVVSGRTSPTGACTPSVDKWCIASARTATGGAHVSAVSNSACCADGESVCDSAEWRDGGRTSDRGRWGRRDRLS